MPKQTFYNLPIEKQMLLLKASKEEFSKNLFTEVSINKIIKDCGISRGSFYMYFDDKEDLYHYLIKTVHENLFKGVIEIIRKNDGYLKKSFEELFERITDKCNNDNQFMQKVFLNANYKNEDQVFMKKDCNSKDEFMDELLKEINIRNIKKEIDMKILLRLHFMTMSHNIVHFIKDKENKETIKKEFSAQLSIIEMGYKEEK